MREPAFWWRERGAASALLAPFAALYGSIAAQRMRRDGAHAGVPVICIGNLTLGGTGKTPTAIAVAQLLAAQGEHPFLLTRGYGGTLSGPVRVDGKRHTAHDVGDEALLLARVAPTIVARDRAAGAAVAHAGGASVIIMDDGLQNPSLHKTLALAVIDGRRGIGNGLVFPAGPLRAPFATQLERVHALLVMGPIAGAKPIVEAARQRALPIFHGALSPDAAALAALSQNKALAFAGIGDPEKFFATLAAAGIDAPIRRGFADHHRYIAAEAAELITAADRDGLALVTTEKDLARMGDDPALASLAARARPLPVRLNIEEAAEFERLVRRAVRPRA